MASVFDVAKYILENKGPVSTWKLQKLCYYAQAWHYTWTEKPLFAERFEAWVNGPVCPDLFNRHKGQFAICEKDSVNVVLRDYGGMEPYALRELTHSEDPWKNARGGLKENEKCTTEITPEAMGLYYGSL